MEEENFNVDYYTFMEINIIYEGEVTGGGLLVTKYFHPKINVNVFCEFHKGPHHMRNHVTLEEIEYFISF